MNEVTSGFYNIKMSVIPLLILGILITTNAAEFTGELRSICYSADCNSTASYLLENTMDRSVKPCDNFYKYVCGKMQLPSAIVNVAELKKSRLIKLVNETTEIGPKYLKKIKQYFRVCTDKDRLNKSKKNFKKVLKELGGWPVLTKKAQSDQITFNLTQMVHKLRKTGFSMSYFFDLDFPPNETDSTFNIQISQPYLGMERQYLVNGRNSTKVKAYFDFMVDVAKILGAHNNVEQELKRSLEFEIELAKISPSPKELENYTNFYNPISIKELQSKYPFIQWLEYFNGILSPYHKINSTEKINLATPLFFNKFFTLMVERKLNGRDLTDRDLANYALWRVTLDSIDALSSGIHKAKTKFLSALTGEEYEYDYGLNRAVTCIEEINKNMYLATGSMFVKQYYDDNKTEDVRKIYEAVRVGLRQVITKHNWMDANTKEVVLEKLSNIDAFIGYPPELLDESKLDDYYENFEVAQDSHLQTVLNFNLFYLEKNILNLLESYDKSNWRSLYGDASNVDVIFNPSNAIFVPAGCLDNAIFNENLPNFMKYGGLGYFLGNALMYAFDVSNRLYDKKGNLNDLWSPESIKGFSNVSQCIIDKYSNYKFESTSTRLDGGTTVSENIANIGGLRAAYIAYQELLRNQPLESTLPGFEDQSPGQMFFIAFASFYCTKPTINEVENTKKSPLMYPVLDTLTNLHEFANEFECSSEDNMNPPTKCDL